MEAMYLRLAEETKLELAHILLVDRPAAHRANFKKTALMPYDATLVSY